MKVFRRSVFGLLIAGVSCLLLNIVFWPNHAVPFYLGAWETASVFVFLIWAVVFLKQEPTLTRAGLGLLILIAVVLIYIIVTAPKGD
jgi:hypothetical protein